MRAYELLFTTGDVGYAEAGASLSTTVEARPGASRSTTPVTSFLLRESREAGSELTLTTLDSLEAAPRLAGLGLAFAAGSGGAALELAPGAFSSGAAFHT